MVLATSLAESSLTIEGVRAVVDSGHARVPVQDDGSGLTRLATVPASLASVDQRRGRAGACYFSASFLPFLVVHADGKAERCCCIHIRIRIVLVIHLERTAFLIRRCFASSR